MYETRDVGTETFNEGRVLNFYESRIGVYCGHQRKGGQLQIFEYNYHVGIFDRQILMSLSE